MRILIFFLLALFTFQILDVPPNPNHLNPKTCCGRTVCLCKHAKGAFCPFRHGLSEDFQENKAGHEISSGSSHKSCHLHAGAQSDPVQAVKDALPAGVFALAKAPCASDTPKTVLPEYSKDFLFTNSSDRFVLPKQNFIPSRSFNAPVPLLGPSIDRPPRIF